LCTFVGEKLLWYLQLSPCANPRKERKNDCITTLWVAEVFSDFVTVSRVFHPVESITGHGKSFFLSLPRPARNCGVRGKLSHVKMLLDLCNRFRFLYGKFRTYQKTARDESALNVLAVSETKRHRILFVQMYARLKLGFII
jgi:hypothetical protein